MSYVCHSCQTSAYYAPNAAAAAAAAHDDGATQWNDDQSNDGGYDGGESDGWGHESHYESRHGYDLNESNDAANGVSQMGVPQMGVPQMGVPQMGMQPLMDDEFMMKSKTSKSYLVK